MGGLSDMLKLLPGMSKAQQAQVKNANVDDDTIKRQLAMLSSMTPRERRRPEIIKASRKQRVAAGSGTTVQEINRLLKQHKEASRMVKRVSKMGKKGLMRGAMSQMFGRGGMTPGMMTGPSAAPGGALPPGFPGLGGGAGGLQLPPGLGGLGKKK